MTDQPAIVFTDQPVSDIQLAQLKIEWVRHDTIKPNSYNPNRMSWHERQLLRQSLLEDGWTQPIVCLPDHTIVDGEQRWTTARIETTPAHIQEVIAKMEKRRTQGATVSDSVLSRLRFSLERLEAAIAAGEPACIASITGGLVPITVINLTDEAHRMISTIRHNRARGVHRIDSMSDITADLVKLGLDVEDLEQRLGMDEEEITRLMQSSEMRMESLGVSLGDDFSPSMPVTQIGSLSTSRNVPAGMVTDPALKERQLALAAREADIRQKTDAQAAASERPLTQDERAALAKKIGKDTPLPPPLPKIELRKLAFFVSPEEETVIYRVLGPEVARNLVALCRSLDQQPPAAASAAETPAATVEVEQPA